MPYFDPTRMLVVDPMHNLFIGTAKHILKDIWMSSNSSLLSTAALHTIQDRIDDIIYVPTDIGRIPWKIETGFSGSTSVQELGYFIFSSVLF